MFRKSTIVTMLVIAALNGYAQKKAAPKKEIPSTESTAQKGFGVPFFDRTVHDYGTIQEEKGISRTSFTFKNIGTKPLKITKVEVSCGCTATDYSKEEVAPGATGKIDVQYDATNRPGPFNKPVTVHTDGSPSYITLTIKGEVVPINMEVKKIYPFVQGNSRLTTNAPFFKRITEKGKDSVFVGLYNTHPTKTLNIISHKAPPHIKVVLSNKNILPKSDAFILLNYNAELVKDLGERVDEVIIKTDDDSIPIKRVIVKANIEQDFDHVDPKIKSKPAKIVWAKTEHHFGEVYVSEKVTYEFEFVNKGKSDLVIRKAAGSCGCTATNVKEPIVVKKGKKGKLKVTFEAPSDRGKTSKTITVYANDPNNPITQLTIKADVILPGVDK